METEKVKEKDNSITKETIKDMEPLDNAFNNTNEAQDSDSEGMFTKEDLQTSNHFYGMSPDVERRKKSENKYPLFGTHIREAVSVFKKS